MTELLPLYVLSFDRDGTLVDPDDVLGRVLSALGDPSRPFTDVFVMSHGWLNNRQQALASYRSWTDAMLEHPTELRRRGPGFRALVIGVHWPSAPWLPSADGVSLEVQTAFHSSVLGDPDAAEELLPLLTKARAEPEPPSLGAREEELFLALDARAGLGTGQVGAAPGQDRETFDPAAIFHDFRKETQNWRGPRREGSWASLLAPLWVTSFWTMKRRALRVGTAGLHDLLALLQRADATQAVRWHLAGHSFGAIVCAAGLRGPHPGVGTTRTHPPAPGLPRPVQSFTMLQGALSAWSFAGRIPNTDRQGYFRSLITDGLVAGPMLSTYSSRDRALGWFYQLASRGRIPTQRPSRVPRYVAVGSHGVAGLSADDLSLLSTRLRPAVNPIGYTNVDCSAVMRGSSFSVQGGQSDSGHAELAGLLWAAATSSSDSSHRR